MTRTQVVTTTTNLETALSAATSVATNLRAAGNKVTLSEPFMETEGRKAGLASVILTIEEPVEPAGESGDFVPASESVSAGEPVAPADVQTPAEPAPVTVTEAPAVTTEVVVGAPAPEPEVSPEVVDPTLPPSTEPTSTEESGVPSAPDADVTVAPTPSEEETSTEVEVPGPNDPSLLGTGLVDASPDAS